MPNLQFIDILNMIANIILLFTFKTTHSNTNRKQREIIIGTTKKK